MITIQAMPTTVTQNVGGLWLPNSWNEYCPATWDRFAITMTSAAMIPQPPIQPERGPSAFVTQLKVVPQSGSARFM